MEDMQVEEPPQPQPSAEVVETNGVPEGEENKEVAVEQGFKYTGKVVQITNVSPGATLQQLATLFGFLGTVTDIRMYPSEENLQITVKLCYIKYENSEQCGVAQHLTNTVFIDKPLIVAPMNREEIPEESECKHLISTINAYASTAATGYLPQFFPPDNKDGGLPGLPPPPVITSTTDPVEIEEIKRTIFVENIAECLTSEQMMAFFSGVGEIKYLRFVKGDTRYCFIEFTNFESVPTALQYNGVLFGGECLKVEYSKSAIVKPESERIASGRNAVRKSQRDAVKRPSSAEPRGRDRPRVFTSRSRSRTRSKSRRSRSRDRRFRRSRSRTKSPRRRKSRSKSRSPIRRRSPVRKRRSRTPRKSRSRSTGKSRRRSKSKSKSKSRSPRRRRRSRSKEKRRRSKRSPSRSNSRSPRRRRKKSKSRSKSRSTSPKKKSSRKSGSRSPDRSSSSRKKRSKSDKGDKDKDKDKSDKKDKKEKSKEKEGEKDEKELKNLLTKIYTFEEEKEREKKEKKGDEGATKKE